MEDDGELEVNRREFMMFGNNDEGDHMDCGIAQRSAAFGFNQS